ncbi:ABC transporter permease [Acuticoccus sediminis]|uniref:ABC transporter permease n=1 Tax=Acuticoccus sediminis TaxID=2184697 RepID=A0A8B2NM70_9HYPH|nr:ABC transporter substrate-binding protein [Acuticoccus sediminis]RAH97346.1 ABC transporter permease [Acuticoccus sediminis]
MDHHDSRRATTRAATGLALVLSAVLSAVTAPPAAAEMSDGALKIGIINDQSGPLSDLAGLGSVVAAELAIEDFAKLHPDVKVELLAADHQNKADIGAQIVRRWFDVDGVDMVADASNSAVALAVQALAREANKIVGYAAVGTTEINGAQCAPTGLSWLHDNYNLVSGPVRELVGEGLDNWFFIAADYAFGHNMVAESDAALAKAGGTKAGAIFHPLGVSDYAAFLLQAQASGADVVAFANAGEQLVTAMKQWNEFGMGAAGQTAVAELMFLTDVHSMGLETAQGLTTVTAWYWDLDDETRAFAERFAAKHGRAPTAPQASVYSAVLHYLTSAAAVGTDDTDTVLAKMIETPVNDMFARNASIRADGKLVHDFYLVRAKKPADLEKPWAYYDVVKTIPAAEAYLPLSESLCPLVPKS